MLKKLCSGLYSDEKDSSLLVLSASACNMDPDCSDFV